MRLSRVILALLAATIRLQAQSPVVAPNGQLVVQGIPPVPRAVADAVGRYTEFRSAALWGWHPMRREILIGTRFADVVQAHQVRMPGGDRRQLTFFPDRVLNARYQPTDGRYLVLERDVGGSEFNQLYRFDPTTGETALLTDGKSKNDLGPWSNDGSRIAYASTRRNGTDDDVYIVDPSTPASDRLLVQVEGGGWAPLDWSPDDRSLLVGQFISVNESYLWLVDVATGAKTPLTPKGAHVVAYNGGQFSHDGRSVYVSTDEGSEFQHLIAIDLATQSHRPLTQAAQWDVEQFALARDGRTLAYVTNEAGVSVLHLIDPATGAERRTPAFGASMPTGVIGGLVWHRNSRDLGFSATSARATLDAYSLDVTTGKVDRWTASETGGIDPAQFVEPQLIHWKGADGLALSGFLYRPPAHFTGKRPVIINIHGGPEGQSRPVFLGRTNYIVGELGVAELFPNIRGSTGYGKSFVAADNGVKRTDAYTDIGTLLDWIATQPDLDSHHVMVTGGSYGGHMTLVSSVLYADRITCALDIVGMSSLATFLEHTESYRRDLRRAEYGDERDSTVRAFMERTAPLNNADKIAKPLFVVAGANDPRVPKTEADQIVAAVRQHGTPVWYLVATDEGHGFAKKTNLDYLQYATVVFIQQYLLGGSGGTPATQ